MSRPATLEEKVVWAERFQGRYEAKPEVKKRLAEITLVLVIGPTAIGKSYLIEHTIALNPEKFSLGGSITSRPPKAGDPSSYKTDVPIDNLISRIKQGDLVQYTVHQKSRQIYGLDLDSLPTQFVFLPTLSSSVEDFYRLGFGRVVPVGLITDGTTWSERLTQREEERDYTKRVQESIDSVEWLQAHQDHVPIFENGTGDVVQAAQNIANIAEGRNIESLSPDRIKVLSRELIRVAQSELEKHDS